MFARRLLVPLAGFLLASSSISADELHSIPRQNPPVQTALSQVTAVSSNQLTLLDGTPIRLKLKRNLSSADARVDDQVDFEALEDVTVDGVLVIPKGSVAIGTITQAQAKRRMARGGKLDLNIDYVRLADMQKAQLRAVKATKGGGHTGGMVTGIVVTSLVVWPAAPLFLLMHGKDVTIPEGTEITAYIDGDTHLDRQKFISKIATDQTVPPLAAQTPDSPQSVSAPAADPAAAAVTVAFRSSPDGAEISVDGKYVGDTPSTLNLASGEHTITIKKSGYLEWQRTLTTSSGNSLTINAALEKQN